MLVVGQLHESLFGYIPDKAGTAYERIGAVVLATLGWRDVIHDVREQPLGRRASHQLDIVARHPSGEVRRLLVECKDWDRTVGKRTLDALVGVRAQTGADAAAVITRKGYTRGAVKVAYDEGIAIIRLDTYDPERDGTNFVKRVVVTATMLAPPERSHFDIEFADPDDRTRTVVLKLTGADHFLLADGSRAERIQDVVEANVSPATEGVFEQREELPAGRFLPTVDGPPVEIAALTWTETNRGKRFDVVREAKGTPVVVLQQLDDSGAVGSGRLVVSEDLLAWDIDHRGTVVPRGRLNRGQTGIDARLP